MVLRLGAGPEALGCCTVPDEWRLPLPLDLSTSRSGVVSLSILVGICFVCFLVPLLHASSSRLMRGPKLGANGPRPRLGYCWHINK
ncbi:hypothetical protein AUP68_15116 [Ilyonectria robusta]